MVYTTLQLASVLCSKMHTGSSRPMPSKIRLGKEIKQYVPEGGFSGRVVQGEQIRSIFHDRLVQSQGLHLLRSQRSTT